jgi:hypothetical protein
MGAAPDANLIASIAGERVQITLTGEARDITAHLCKTCFLALKDWLARVVTPEIGPHVPKVVIAEIIPPVPKGPLPTR